MAGQISRNRAGIEAKRPGARGIGRPGNNRPAMCPSLETSARLAVFPRYDPVMRIPLLWFMLALAG
jgi:hypothetical protein